MAQEPVSFSMEGTSAAERERSRPAIGVYPSHETHPTRLSGIGFRAVAGLAVIMLVAAAGLFTFRTSYADRVYPSVFVANVPVGGLTYTEAKDAVQRNVDELLATKLAFSYAGSTWQPTLAELGVTVDASGSIEAAFEVGREEDAKRRVQSTLDLVNGERSVPLRISVDETTFDRWMSSVELQLGQPPRDAIIQVKNGKVKVIDDVDGLVIDRTAARLLLDQSLLTMLPYSGELPIDFKPAFIHTEDLAPVAAKLETALSASVRLSHGDKRWKLMPKEMGTFVVIDVNRDAPAAGAVTVKIDEDKLADYLKTLLSEEVNRDPTDAEIAWSYDKGRVVAIVPSTDGARLRPVTLAKDVAVAFFSEKRTVKVSTTVIKPEIDSNNLGALGITTRLAVGDSNFAGSDGGRATNVVVGASLLNGALVPPNGEFSFNRSIGEIRAELGYVEAGVVDGERIGKDIGGGICQVSTTVFRAAFFAGLPIEEWNPHRYRLGFYESDGYGPGLDASILQPEGDPFNGGDFRFSNPSDSWLLIEAYADSSRVYVTIFGPDLGYKVDVTGPWYSEQEYPPTDDLEIIDYELPAGTVKQTELATEGMDVFYQRTVYDKNGDLLWDRQFGTHFYARGNVYKVSPDMQGQSPAAQQGE